MMTMRMRRVRGAMHLSQRADGDPSAETDQSDTGDIINDVAEARGKGDSGDPYCDGDQQG